LRPQTPYTRAQICAALGAQASPIGDDMVWLADASEELRARVRAKLPARPVAAAVLVPLIEHPEGHTVLLTLRATHLKDHAGQVSFPGGRIEVSDVDAQAAAWREADEEVGLAADAVEFAGYLPDHLIATGFRVTPVVGFVQPGYRLNLDAAEVEEAFEVPLQYLFDPANHQRRSRRLGDLSLDTIDIPFGSRLIWGATAGILMTFRRLLAAATTAPPA
jgi:8-oxo-dGTP pyrophosphatase MutT (NUDIX family)